ncbi:phosphogluconate dehydrogenase C-terminal domain-containing protein [Flexithrix dorotheae]|uniref:phosphogluconate dehydrogenase C-terminal domain-containing protein n=1 Tax=Flexithrix dorotheae TaxID=70993 RepID=UPI0003827A69|nr:phosphogluconate dehydrogenase C-terminal domain-containing protein [Flexithrix dorotheae]
MTKVTIVGAGGKMGCRLTDNLKDSKYDMTYLEVSPEGIEKVKSRGVDVSKAEDAVPEADYVIFAVPDIAIKSVTSKIVPMMKPGAVGVSLDPAAPLAGHLFAREDISYFASHPSHPSVFNWEPNEKAHFDYFGGIAAKQTIVCALIQGPEEVYAAGEELAKIMYAPVTVSHRITIEQMGILEPALSETFGAAVVSVLKEGVDRVVELGVPKEAAYDFFLGHINIELALLFNQLPGGQFSDAALKAINIGKELIFKENWKDVFEAKSVKEQIIAIT